MLSQEVLKKLEAIEQRFEELTALLSDPAVASNGDRFRKVSKERASLEPTVEALRAYRKLVEDIADNEALLAERTPTCARWRRRSSRCSVRGRARRGAAEAPPRAEGSGGREGRHPRDPRRRRR